MQKKQKSHRPRKVKSRKKLPKRQRSFANDDRIYVAGSTGSGKKRTEALNVPSMNATLPDMSEAEARSSLNIKERPSIEIHTRSEVTPISNVQIMQGAMMMAGLRVTNEIRGVGQNQVKILNNIPFRKIGINDIEKVVLKKFSEHNWGVTFYILDEDGDDGIFTSGSETEPGYDSMQSAINYVQLGLGELIYEDALVNPANTLIKRTFLFGSTILMVGNDSDINTAEKLLQQDQSGSINFDTISHLFQEIADKLGGVLTNDRVSGLNPQDGDQLYRIVAIALALGARKWPFEGNWQFEPEKTTYPE